MRVTEHRSILLRPGVPFGIALIASVVLLQGCMRVGDPGDAPEASSRVQGVGPVASAARPDSIGASGAAPEVLASGIPTQEQVASADTGASRTDGADNLRRPRRDRN